MGLIYALAAYLSWGLVVPIHFRLLDATAPDVILAHRIVWSAGFVALLLAGLRRRVASPFPLRARHGLLVLSALAIAVNWLLYLAAVGSGHMLDASLGYYINPLVSVVLGRVVLGERLRPAQALAVAVAALGVALTVAMAGRLPALSPASRSASRSTGCCASSPRSRRWSASSPRRCCCCRSRSPTSRWRRAPCPWIPGTPSCLP